MQEREIIQAGFRTLQECDEPRDDWLQAEIATAYDAWKANPGNVMTAEEVAAGSRRVVASRLRMPNDPNDFRRFRVHKHIGSAEKRLLAEIIEDVLAERRDQNLVRGKAV